MTSQMMVALGEDGIKTIEDFAGCAADDLVGWSERKDGETKKFEGLFSKFDISRAEAEAMVVQARLAAPAGSPRKTSRPKLKANSKAKKPSRKRDERARRPTRQRPKTTSTSRSERTDVHRDPRKRIARYASAVRGGPDGTIVPDLKRTLPGRGLGQPQPRGCRQGRGEEALRPH